MGARRTDLTAVINRKSDWASRSRCPKVGLQQESRRALGFPIAMGISNKQSQESLQGASNKKECHSGTRHFLPPFQIGVVVGELYM